MIRRPPRWRAEGVRRIGDIKEEKAEVPTDTNLRPRARDLGIEIGQLPTGKHNAITDIHGVRVGHVTLRKGSGRLEIGRGPVRTGVTAIIPVPGNIYKKKPAATVHIINGYGKSLGFPQVAELGNLETPIVLTNTLSVWTAADAVVDYVSKQNPTRASFNPVVGECNDGRLNDILGRHVKKRHVLRAIKNAESGPVPDGNIGAGMGMSGFGFKAGIGTASRVVGRHAIGVLVLMNTGGAGNLVIDGVHIGHALDAKADEDGDGSIMIVLATDAPFYQRRLTRLAKRAAFGLARTGANASHGSGDFVIAFSTTALTTKQADEYSIPEQEISTYFWAVIEATEEAILNSILRCDTVTGRDGNTRNGIPIEPLKRLLEHGKIS
ncbi:MAG: P1 family peptidase [Planctomycetes bacterium]|nr:P1 family peptidase [Planctomycetota bacterium]